MSCAHGSSIFKQPKAVFPVAFACVVSCMCVGLVDPILPALSEQLHATPIRLSLLFTGYLVVTAVAMVVTGWVSSRIGTKWTLIAGLVLIVVFSAAAGLTDSIGGIVGFRAGWGLDNALFVATSVAVIVASATGYRMLRDADARMTAEQRTEDEIAGEVADEFGGASSAIDDDLSLRTEGVDRR
jgi:MFS family permease